MNLMLCFERNNGKSLWNVFKEKGQRQVKNHIEKGLSLIGGNSKNNTLSGGDKKQCIKPMRGERNQQYH